MSRPLTTINFFFNFKTFWPPLYSFYLRSLWGKPATMSWGHSSVLGRGPCSEELRPSALRRVRGPSWKQDHQPLQTFR